MKRPSGALRRAVVVFAIATVGVLAFGAQAASASVIEICKSSANGMSGRTFQYSILGGASVSVNGGRCSGPITVAGSSVTITEAQSNPATDVASTTVRPSLRKLSENLPGRSVTVQTGASTSSETLVTFTNQPAGGTYGTLKICKFTSTPAYLGRLFSFRVNGGPLVSVEATTALYATTAEWSCRPAGTFPVGTLVNVREQIPAGTEVQWVDADPFTALENFDISTGDTWVRIGATATAVLYDDEALPPSSTGWLEICKDAAPLANGSPDPAVVGPFLFTVEDALGFSYDAAVLAGQCSAPIEVDVGLAQVGGAGVVHVTEQTQPGFSLVDAFTIPSDRLLTADLGNHTADVEVPPSADPADETQVHFVNKAQRGQLKICKALGPGSADLIGQDFYFNVHPLDGGNDLTGIEITAQAQTQCVIVGNFPTGSTVDVEENLAVFGIGQIDPTRGQSIDTSGGGPITIAPGINTKTITNTARGLLEICKHTVVGMNTQPTFQFRVDGGTILNIRAGTCSLPMRVSVGTHAVTELASTNYELDPNAPGNGITVVPADREVSRTLATRTVTVSVPYGANGETLVTYYNRIKRAQVKLCKTIPPTSQDALGGKAFTYLVGQFTHIGPIYPGECILVPGDFPILSPAGQPATLTVHEDGTPSTTWDVTSITVTGGRSVQPPDLTNGNITFYVAPGVNVVTYRNTAKDP